MIAQFASREVAGLAVELELKAPDGTRLRHAGTTDEEGFVKFDVALEGDWSLAAHPEWEVSFDMDKAAATATRKKMLDMLAADNLPFVGYHMPWPAFGYVEKQGDGYRYRPHSYQLLL